MKLTHVEAMTSSWYYMQYFRSQESWSWTSSVLLVKFHGKGEVGVREV